MSKIPQGEWTAIAARYAQGETISRIAQSYGCTPPAIHYILKRNKQRTASSKEQPVVRESERMPSPRPETAQTTTTATPSRFAEARREPNDDRTFLHQNGQLKVSIDRGAPSPAQPMLAQARPAPSPVPSAGSHKRGSAFSAGLDQDLHGRAEAAIEAFRSSFDAALMESSAAVRQRLREAASDLMRVAARTTIVLDRLNANAERTAMRTPDHLRSAQNGEYH